MKNFLFGRGAACSTCATGAPAYGITPPMEPGCGYEPSCGREPVCGYEPTCGYEPAYTGPLSGLRRGCGLLRGQATCGGSPTCGCNSGMQSYMPTNVDPYYGQVHDPYAYGGEVIGSQVIGDTYNGYPIQGTIVSEGIVPGSSYPIISQDNFDSRPGTVVQPVPAPQPVPQP
ncbi:MAG: hypothetical protein ACO1RT_04850 [Planctomycetaceae bacterium]